MTYDVCTRIDDTFLAPREYFEPVPKNTIFGNTFARSWHRSDWFAAISDLKLRNKYEFLVIRQGLSWKAPEHLDWITSMWEIYLDPIRWVSIEFRMAYADSKIDCFHSILNDVSHSFVRQISHRQAFRWWVAVKSVQSNPADRQHVLIAYEPTLIHARNRLKEHQELKIEINCFIIVQQKIGEEEGGGGGRKLLPRNLNALGSLKSFEIFFSSSTPSGSDSNRAEAKKPWICTLRIDFNWQ